MARFVSVAGMVLVVLSAAPARPEGPSSAPASDSRPATTMPGVIRLEHLRVDTEARKVVVDAQVCLGKQGLELLLCKEGTKDYESILSTCAEPWQVHAALLLLGLSPGKPAEWSGSDDHAVFLPPRGAELKITIAWKNENQEQRQSDAADWLEPVEGRKPKPPKTWVFVGSETLPGGQYWADEVGEIISVSNFASSVIDVPFESSEQAELLAFRPNEDVIPPAGTEVQIIIEPVPGAENAPHARATLDIDRWGRMKTDGKDIRPDALAPWATEFLRRHEKGRVVIQAAARAMVHYIDLAEGELRFGGVREFDHRRLPAEGFVLPRTPDQARTSLEDWRRRFENPRDYIREPAAHADEVLEQVWGELRELERLKALWQEYELNVRKELEAYKASTQPSGPQPEGDN